MKYTTWKKLSRKIDDEMWSFQKIYFLHGIFNANKQLYCALIESCSWMKSKSQNEIDYIDKKLPYLEGIGDIIEEYQLDELIFVKSTT